MKEILKEMEKLGVIRRNGHFVYTSGSHGSVYFNKDAIFPHTELISSLAEVIARDIVRAGLKIDAVIGPAVGGVIMSQWTAHHLGLLQKNDVIALYADKMPKAEGFIIKRGYDKLITGKQVLVVEDVINTGDTVVKLINQVRAENAEPVAVACLCNRGGKTAHDLGVDQIINLIQLDLQINPASDCSLCEQKIPIDTDLGKGKLV